jgi:hypothetical protein
LGKEKKNKNEISARNKREIESLKEQFTNRRCGHRAHREFLVKEK